MRDGYLSHFGLREPPFSKEILDADLWLPSSKQAVVDELCDVVETRASGILVGDPGVGKTSCWLARSVVIHRQGRRGVGQRLIS